MAREVMMGMIRDHGSRKQYEDACTYWARGNNEGIARIYRLIVGA